MRNPIDFQELKLFLDEKADFYENKSFIENDPLQIPHRFTLREDIEISAFLTATISWGNRKSIINSAEKMLNYMENSPFDFVKNFTEKDLKLFKDKSIHRTFNGDDFSFFLNRLKVIYNENQSLEKLFLLKENETDFYHALERFRTTFLGGMEHRSKKHISSTYKNASAKRLVMFLRWMIRQNSRGVDFGLWKNTNQKYLSVPLDVHTGNISRQLNLIQRTQNDWKTVVEMNEVLRKMDADDPAKYDFALFGLGVSGDF